MGTLRSKIIRLAHQHPELRPTLLPLVTKTAWEELDPEKILKGEIPESVMSELLDGLSNGIGETAADLTDNLPDDTRESVGDALWKAAITEFAKNQGLTCSDGKKASFRSVAIRLAHKNPRLRPCILPRLAKMAGNLGEELNPYMLNTSIPGWEKVNIALQALVETTAQDVRKVIHGVVGKMGPYAKYTTGYTREQFMDDLQARVISAVYQEFK